MNATLGLICVVLVVFAAGFAVGFALRGKLDSIKADGDYYE